jgi:hypothetical protein
MAYDPPDCGTLIARAPSSCGALMTYRTMPEYVDLRQDTTQRTAPMKGKCALGPFLFYFGD